MTKLSAAPSSQFVKLFLIGDSGAGKTGSLISLIKAGYKLRIIDLDNGLTALRMFVQRECPDLIDNVEVETLRDTYKASPTGPRIKGQPKAYLRTLELLTKWSDDSNPGEWGGDYVMVLDSMTFLGKAAYAWAQSLNPGAKDPRQWFYTAQRSIENVIDMLFGSAMNTNVIVISHITTIEVDGINKGYPTTIGTALSKHISQYSDVVLMAETSGQGKNVKRHIRTVPTPSIDLKNPAPFKVEAQLDFDTGLADFFTMIKE